MKLIKLIAFHLLLRAISAAFAAGALLLLLNPNLPLPLTGLPFGMLVFSVMLWATSGLLLTKR